MRRRNRRSHRRSSRTISPSTKLTAWPAPAATSSTSTAATAAGGDEDQTLQAHATPGRILASETFDIEVYEKVTEPGPTGTAAAAGTDIFSVVKIQDCRLTRRGMTLNKRGLYVDNYAFVGVLVADGNNDGVGFDSLSNSGVGPDLG